MDMGALRLVSLVVVAGAFASTACSSGDDGGDGKDGKGGGAQESNQTSGNATYDPNRKLSDYDASDLAAQCKANQGKSTQDRLTPEPQYGPNTLRQKCGREASTAAILAQSGGVDAMVNACVQARDECIARGGKPKASESKEERPFDPKTCDQGAALAAALMAQCHATGNDFRVCQDERLVQIEEAAKSRKDTCDAMADTATESDSSAESDPPAQIPSGPACKKLEELCPSLAPLFVLGLGF